MAEKVKVSFNGIAIELDKDVFSQGIEKGEVIITDETFKVFTVDELTAREKKIESTSYNKGKGDGVEIEAKESKRKLGLDIQGKNFDEIFDAYRTKVLADAKIEPSKKIQELEADKLKLQKNITDLEAEKTSLTNSFALKEKESKVNSLLFHAIPEKAVTETLSRNDITALFKANGYGVDIQDGKEVATFNGEVMKNDKTLEPLPVKSVVEKFVTDKKLIKVEGGGGGKDDVSKDKPGTLDAFNKEMEAAGHKYNDDYYIAEQRKRIKDGTLKV